LDEPQAVRQMQAFVRDQSAAANYQELLERALDGALSMLGADVGTVALCDPATGALRIVAQRGFSAEFLEHFAVVTDAGTARGRAAYRSAQSVIVDIDLDPGLGAHRWIAAVSGFRAVQSTPLIDDDNRVRGIISAHFRRPHHLRSQDLQIIAWYGQLTARALAAQQSAPLVLYETAVTCHEGTADRHDAVAAVLRSCAYSLMGVGAVEGGAQARAYAERAQARARRERERGSERRRRLSRDIDHLHDVSGGAPEQP
jgi:hypothetical protein